MCDNITLSDGSGALLAADDVNGVHVVRVKVQTGAPGSATDVSAANPIPVSLVTPIANVTFSGPLPAGTNTIGSVNVASLPSVTLAGPLPAGANKLGSVDVTSLPSLPAGTNAIGSVAVTSLPAVNLTGALPAGTNRIGDVGIATLPPLPAGTNAIGSVNVTSLPNVTLVGPLPAGTNKLGSVDVANFTSLPLAGPLPAGTNKLGSVDVASLPPLPAGSNAIGSVAVSALPAVTVGSALPTGANTIGVVNLAPTKTGGLSIFRKIGLSSTGLLVKTGAGQAYGWHFANSWTSAVFVKLYDVSAAPKVGTDVPVVTLYLPSGQPLAVDYTLGIAFLKGIGIAATTGFADTDTGAPSANTVFVNLFYV